MRGFKIDDLPKRYQRQVKEQIAGQNRVTRPPAHVEQAIGNALVAKEKAKGYNGLVSLRIFEYRHRLADPDGACTKYLIDSLVSSGLLQDDSSKFIKKIEKEQFKIDKTSPEKTIVEIWTT